MLTRPLLTDQSSSHIATWLTPTDKAREKTARLLSMWNLFQAQGLEHLSSTRVADALPVVFRLGAEHYHIPTHRVITIQPLGFYTPIPFTEEWIVGVVGWQERLIGVIDIGPLLTFSRTTVTPDTLIIVVALHHMEIGIVADSIIPLPEVSSEAPLD